MTATDSPLHDVKILFFDIGNVLVSDDPSAIFLYRCLYDWLPTDERGNPEEFFARRREHILEGGNLWSFIKKYIPEPEFTPFRERSRSTLFRSWQEMSPEIPGMGAAVRELAKHYRLGIIANQPVEVDALLEARGILELFEVRAISEALKLDKPDPRIFQWAIEKAGILPHEALMIGDRIDNDIKPAKALGMRTLWMRLSFDQRGWTPGHEFEAAYVNSLDGAYVSYAEPVRPEEQPDLIACSPEELVSILTPLQHQEQSR